MMQPIMMKRCIEQDETDRFSAVIKLGTYATAREAEAMAQMMIMLFKDAAQGDGIKMIQNEPTEVRDITKPRR